MVQVACTRPWQAPEHKQAVSFQLEAARQMDVYSFGMLLCRTLLSDELHDSIGLLANCNDPKEHLHLVEMIESLKSSSQFLNLVLEALERSTFIAKSAKHVLRQIFEMTLQHDPRLRAPDFFSIASLIYPENLLYDNPPMKILIFEVDKLIRDSPAATDFGIINTLPHALLDVRILTILSNAYKPLIVIDWEATCGP
jgi:serine/threonine protein kinase